MKPEKERAGTTPHLITMQQQEQQQLPIEAIVWMTINASSNTELATLSNICTHWRNIIMKTTTTIICCNNSSGSKKKDDEDDDANINTIETILSKLHGNKETYNYYPFETLLLPSMIQEYNRHCYNNNSTKTTTIQEKGKDETYCLSWFAPNNIQFTSIPIYQKTNKKNSTTTTDDDNSSTYSSSSSSSSTCEYESSSTEYARNECIQDGDTPKNAHRVREKSRKKLIRNQSCVVLWNSYKEAMDVLKPFGYSTHFIKMIFSTNEKIMSLSILNNNDSSNNSSGSNRATYAVRGALEARPEGISCNTFYQSILSTASQSNKSFLPIHNQNNNPTKKQLKQLKRYLPRVISSPNNNRQRSIQCLNAIGTHAVRLQTLPFTTIAPQPITIFCVGIVMEDGCLLDGLNAKFELGHVYPNTLEDDDIEYSPISISTSNHQNSICKGYTGPGKWHVYTAIYNTTHSILRIDGCTENTTTTASNSCGNGLLDGITIGSDYNFEMTLCFGKTDTNTSLHEDNNQDDEGCGAISEVIAWKGLFPEADIQTMERYLMLRHGIPSRSVSTKENSQKYYEQEEQWKRLGCAIMLSEPNSDTDDTCNANRSIPLRILSNHKAVSWYRKNEITGKNIPIRQIGVKLIGGGKPPHSDW